MLLFSQGRADYYIMPLLLIFVGFKFDKNSYKLEVNKNLFFISKYKNILVKLITNFQIYTFLLVGLISIYQSLYTFLYFEDGMNKYASQFNLTNLINNNSSYPAFAEGIYSNLYFLKKDYLHSDVINKCLFYENLNNKGIALKYKECMEKYDTKEVVTTNKLIDKSEFFECSKYSYVSAARNPLRRIKRDFFICKLLNQE